MTYQGVLSDLSETFSYFTSVLSSFIDFIAEYPLLMLGSILIMVFPALVCLFSFIANESHDTVFDMQGVVLNKHDRLVQKRTKENMQREGQALADKFFSKNPQRMSIRINGFTYYQNGFENKNWGNSKKTRVTKKYHLGTNGTLIHQKTSISSTETYDNTSAETQESNYNAD